MFPQPSPLETLIAFGIVFLLGLIWNHLQRQACRHCHDHVPAEGQAA